MVQLEEKNGVEYQNTNLYQNKMGALEIFLKNNSYFFNTIQFLTSIGLTAHDSECGITDSPLTNELITMTIYGYGSLSMIAQHIAYY